jgi:ketosteroid isomerase-like protein
MTTTRAVTVRVPAVIPGGEEQGYLTAPLRALAQFYAAFNGRDLEAMSRNWELSDEVAMDNPLGGIKRGWDEIRAVYERLFNGPARVTVEFYDYSLHETPEMFYVVGRERGRFERGEERVELAIRTGRVFRKRNGQWRQVHHHGSIDDPALLKRYQDAVPGRRQSPLSTHLDPETP